MKIQKYNFLTISLSCLVLSACAASGGPGATKQNEYMMQGCVGGGVLGAILSSALGGDGEDTGKAALFGCAAGAIIAFSVAERTQEYASAGQAIDSEIKRNAENTAKLREYNKGLEANIASYQGQINAVQQQQLAASEKNSRLKKMKSEVSAQASKAAQALQSVNAELSTAKQQHDKYTTQASSGDAKRWEQEVASLEKERDILNSHVQTLSAMNSSI